MQDDSDSTYFDDEEDETDPDVLAATQVIKKASSILTVKNAKVATVPPPKSRHIHTNTSTPNSSSSSEFTLTPTEDPSYMYQYNKERSIASTQNTTSSDFSLTPTEDLSYIEKPQAGFESGGNSLPYNSKGHPTIARKEPKKQHLHSKAPSNRYSKCTNQKDSKEGTCENCPAMRSQIAMLQEINKRQEEELNRLSSIIDKGSYVGKFLSNILFKSSAHRNR